MFEFYKENVKFYLKIAWYRYMLYLLLLVPIFLVATAGVLVLRTVNLEFFNVRVNIEFFNVAVTSIMIAAVIIPLLVVAAFFLKFLFITGYSLVKHSEESEVRLNIFSKIVSKVANPKVLLFAFIILITGYVLYSMGLSGSERLSQQDVNIILFSLAVTMLIYSVLVFLFFSRHRFMHLLNTIWDVLPGMLWKGLVVLAFLASQLLIFGIIFVLVFTFVTPAILG